MSAPGQTLFNGAYVRCPACAAWMPNRADACTECGYQPALGHIKPLPGYAAVRFIAGMLAVLGLGFAVAYAHREPPSTGLDASPESALEHAKDGFGVAEFGNASTTIDIGSRSYVHQLVLDYMQTHSPIVTPGDSIDVLTSDGSRENATVIEVLRYKVRVELSDGTDTVVPFVDLPVESRIRCDEAFRRQFQRRETERVWKLRNQAG